MQYLVFRAMQLESLYEMFRLFFSLYSQEQSWYYRWGLIMLVFGRFGQVCKSWNEIIQQDKHARFKRKAHLSEMEAALEVRFYHISNCC